MPIWKIIIHGDSPGDVHGVNLREAVEKIAHDVNNLKGQVRNIKGTDIVEILCSSDSKKTVNNFRKNIKTTRSDLFDARKITVKEAREIKDGTLKFKKFKIIREDELTEMVWALQAAGKAFLNQEEKRDRIRKDNLIKAVSAEIENMKTVLNELKKGNVYKRFRPIAIQNILKEPPSNCEELMSRLHPLCEYCHEVNTMIEKDDSAKKAPLDEVENGICEVEKTSEIIDIKKKLTASN